MPDHRSSSDVTPAPPATSSTDHAAASPEFAERIAWGDAGFLGAGYRDGSFTPSAVAEVLLERIERLNPKLNAFAAVLAEDVRAQSAKADRELAAGVDRGPLHGVPIAVKDLMHVEGWPTRFGSTVAPVTRADADAEMVARLRQAGAVIIGKTMLLEYAYGAVHPTVGATWNPWSLSRTAGGSSGGSAAALAAGLVPLALGTDTGGSIRIPASYCGVIGLKPTFGRLSLDGVFPLSWSLDAVGPMARTLTDLLALFHVLDGDAGGGSAFEANGSDLRGVRFGIPEDLIARTPLEPGVEALFREAVRKIREAGAEVSEVSLRMVERANELLVDMLRPEATVIHEQHIQNLGVKVAPGGQAEAYSDATLAQLHAGFRVPATAYISAKRLQAQMQVEFASTMQEFDALLTPSVGFVAPEEDPPVDDPSGAAEMHFSAPFNLLGVPALSMPVGFSHGLPVGLQMVAAHGHDVGVMRLAAATSSLLNSLMQRRRPPLV